VSLPLVLLKLSLNFSIFLLVKSTNISPFLDPQNFFGRRSKVEVFKPLRLLARLARPETRASMMIP
jgi:hypothetical protein